jgi:vitamin B12 transporter
MKKKLLPYALLALIGTPFYLSPPAFAAELEERTPHNSLGEVVVSGEGEGVQATQSVQTVTDLDIKSRGARTLDQAIALLPGVNVRTGGDGVPRIDIRGFRTRHVILLLDGIPINSALDQQFDPTIIPAENIAEIKLTSGASSVLYGQGGLGGVINIVTKKGSTGLQGMAGVETGDREPYLAKASLSGTHGKYDYFVSGSSSQVDAFPLSDDFRATSEQGGGYRKNSDKKRSNVFGSVGFTPNKDLAMGLTLGYSQGAFGKPASVINDPFALDPFAAAPKYERIDWFEGYSAQLAADYAISEKLSIRGWAFLNQLDQQDNLYDNANFNSTNLVSGSFRERISTTVKGLSLQPKYDLGRLGKVALSLAAEADHWQNGGTVQNSPDASADKSLQLYSTGIEYEFSPLPKLGLVAGYGHYWQTRDESNSDDYSLLAGLFYDLFAGTRLKASFKRNVRFPALGDLYDLSKGNPNLATERSRSYEGGIEQKLPWNSALSLTGFHTTANNLIQNDQTTSRNTNLAEVRFTGVEIAGSTQFVKNVLLRASYTHLDSQDLSRAGREQQQYTPGDKLALEGKYDFDCGFSPYLSYLFVGNQYFYTKNNVSPVQKAKLSDYSIVNLKLSQRLPGNKLTIYAGADNLFDSNYESSYGLPQAGRFIYGGVECRL